MTHDEVIDLLRSLVRLDYDAVQSYDQAIEQTDEPDVRRSFERFRGDHGRHVDELETMIRQMGGQPLELSGDVKGPFQQAFTALRRETGTHGALSACESGEQYTNRKYSEAASKSLPVDVKVLVDRNFRDEQRHLQYIEASLGAHA